jgi:dipeptidyl aminopeptidase/acylaminoacyl peptidase
MRSAGTLKILWFYLVLAFCGGVRADEALPPLAIEDVFNIQLATDPQISPDGKRIVYVRQFSDIMTDKRHSNLWIVSADGRDHRPLTTGNHNDTSPRWSADGSQVAYLSDRDGGPQIYRRWMDSGQTAKLTNLATAPSGIAWSPDGKWISFTAHLPETKPPLVSMPKPPEGAKWAEPARVIDTLVYRFNGAGYLKPGHTQLFVVPADGGTPRQISHGPFDHGGSALAGGEAAWTPDGKYLILSANRHANHEHDPLNTEVYQFTVADGAVKQLTSRQGPDDSPVVAPDGKRIAYVGFDDRYQGYQVRKLYVMNRDGSEPRLLSGALDRDVQSPRWASDGKGIYFLSADQGNTGLYFQPLQGSIRKVTGNIGSGTSAYGGGTAFSVSRNGNFATTYTRPDVPGDIAVGSGLSDTRVLTAVNQGLLTGRRLGQVEEIWYESSKDHRKIQGWIVKPPDFNPARKYPLILEIHGGPFANYGDRFDLEKQLMAARGYVVFYANPRGSTSYGAEFGNLIHHAYPGDDFYDLNSGVDAVIARGFIDPDELYVTGGSGGGVLTCWVIGHTPRFRAAVTVYPVINWYSWVLNSDIGGWIYRYWFPGLPWDNVEHYEKRSLLSVVKNVKTPTMVLTGEADYRTPMSDSEQYYQALQILGVESVLVRVPDEPHGIAVRPSHHMTKILHILAWFDKHRKAPEQKAAR